MPVGPEAAGFISAAVLMNAQASKSPVAGATRLTRPNFHRAKKRGRDEIYGVAPLAREALHHQIYDKTLTQEKGTKGGPRPAAASAYFMDTPAAAGTLYWYTSAADEQSRPLAACRLMDGSRRAEGIRLSLSRHAHAPWRC